MKTRKKKVARCEWCRKILVVKRKTKRYCSATCRIWASYNRRLAEGKKR